MIDNKYFEIVNVEMQLGHVKIINTVISEKLQEETKNAFGSEMLQEILDITSIILKESDCN